MQFEHSYCSHKWLSITFDVLLSNTMIEPHHTQIGSCFISKSTNSMRQPSKPIPQWQSNANQHCLLTASDIPVHVTVTLHDVQFHRRYMFADYFSAIILSDTVVVSCLELALALSCLIAGSCLITELEGRENPFHLKSEVESNIVSWWSRISSLIRWFQAIWWTSTKKS